MMEGSREPRGRGDVEATSGLQKLGLNQCEKIFPGQCGSWGGPAPASGSWGVLLLGEHAGEPGGG